jgi:hypothetical protein
MSLDKRRVTCCIASVIVSYNVVHLSLLVMFSAWQCRDDMVNYQLDLEMPGSDMPWLDETRF